MDCLGRLIGWSNAGASLQARERKTHEAEDTPVPDGVRGQPSGAVSQGLAHTLPVAGDFLTPGYQDDGEPDLDRLERGDNKHSANRARPSDADRPADITPQQTRSAGRSEAWRAGLRDMFSQGIASLCMTAFRARALATTRTSKVAEVWIPVAGLGVTLLAGGLAFSRGSELLTGGFEGDPQGADPYVLTTLAVAFDLASVIIGGSKDFSTPRAAAEVQIYILQRMAMNMVREWLSQLQLGCWTFARVVRPDRSADIPPNINRILGSKRVGGAVLIDLLINVALMAVALPHLEKAMHADLGSSDLGGLFHAYLPRALLSTLGASLSAAFTACLQAEVTVDNRYAMELIEGGGLRAFALNLCNQRDTLSRVREYGSMRVFMNTPTDVTNAFVDLYASSSTSVLIVRSVAAVLTGLAGSGNFFAEQGMGREDLLREQEELALQDIHQGVRQSMLERIQSTPRGQHRSDHIDKWVKRSLSKMKSPHADLEQAVAQMEEHAGKDFDAKYPLELKSREVAAPEPRERAWIAVYGLIEGTMVRVPLTGNLAGKRIWTAMDILEAMKSRPEPAHDEETERSGLSERLRHDVDFKHLQNGHSLRANGIPVRYVAPSPDDKKASGVRDFRVTVQATVDRPDLLGRPIAVRDSEEARIYEYILNPDWVEIMPGEPPNPAEPAPDQ